MTAWTECFTNFDSIEWASMDWLRSDLPAYLSFHEADLGHLPENFDFDSCKANFEDDARVRAARRIGFLSYSVFVNLATARRASNEVPESFDSLLNVYDHVSRVALRVGAAIDISRQLEVECCGVFAQEEVHAKRAAAPLHVQLKKALDDLDAYNNYLKHTGLPPLRVDSTSDLSVVLVPRRLLRSALDAANASPWSVSKPEAPLAEQASEMIELALRAFNGFYEGLVATTRDRLNDWKATPKESPRGIGQLAIQDGYVLSASLIGSGSLKI